MQSDPSLPPEPLPLTEASVQEIQLELIRRCRFNSFDGPKIVASLRRHRPLWQAVMMDRLGFVTEEDSVCHWGLIKLRDLPRNRWNVDDLFILTDSIERARELQKIAEDEQWQADNVRLIENESERMEALGMSHPGYIVSLWWD
jgi:hypothetical protein